MAQKNNNEVSVMHAFFAYKLSNNDVDLIEKVTQIEETSNGKIKIFGTEINFPDKNGFEDFKNGALGVKSDMVKSDAYKNGKDVSGILSGVGYSIVEEYGNINHK